MPVQLCTVAIPEPVVFELAHAQNTQAKHFALPNKSSHGVFQFAVDVQLPQFSSLHTDPNYQKRKHM